MLPYSGSVCYRTPVRCVTVHRFGVLSYSNNKRIHRIGFQRRLNHLLVQSDFQWLVFVLEIAGCYHNAAVGVAERQQMLVS